MGLLARFFRGGLTISEMMKMTFKEILFWYDIFELQVTEEEVVSNLRFDKKTGKEKTLPNPRVIRKIVEEKIKERKGKFDGGPE